MMSDSDIGKMSDEILDSPVIFASNTTLTKPAKSFSSPSNKWSVVPSDDPTLENLETIEMIPDEKDEIIDKRSKQNKLKQTTVLDQKKFLN